MFTKKIALILFMVAGVAACGGGGSDSGGGAVVPIVDPLPTGKFAGTYQNSSYAGTIEVTINSASNVVIAMTGLPCLASPFSEGMSASVSGDVLVIGGDILGVPKSNIGTNAGISINVPVSGGTGLFDLNPPAPCLSHVDGTISLNP